MLRNVSVHSGCYNRNTIDWWLINNRHLFLIVLEAGKSKIEMPADSVSGEDLLPGPQTPSTCLLTWWKGQGSSLEPP